MNWHDLLFAHWPLPVEVLRPLIPGSLEIDTFDGKAWIAVVPFHMTGVRIRPFPAFPGTGAFPEINLRTYVRSGGRGGVWFFSLDAASRVAVRAARAWFRLPYFDASFQLSERGAPVIRYRSERTHKGAPAALFEAEYQPRGEPFLAARGSIEHWLTERYALFTQMRDGTIRIGEIDHAPWPLQAAEAEIRQNSMAEGLGITLPATPALLHFARDLEVVGWSPAPI